MIWKIYKINLTMIYNLPCKSIHISGCKLIIYFAQKTTFSILQTYFYKIPKSIHLLYTIFYINNIFLFFFNIILSPVSFSYSFSSFFFLISLCRFLFLFLPLLSSSFSHDQINTPSQAPQPSKPTSTTDLRWPTSTYLHRQQQSTSPIHMQRRQWRRWWNCLSNPWSTNPWSSINDSQETISNQSTTSTVPVDLQP